MKAKFQKIVEIIRAAFAEPEDFIPLHQPNLSGNEKKYLNQAIDSTFVSSVGEFVDRFEKDLAGFCGAERAIAVSNGTSALHAALVLVGVQPGDEVITQSLTFIATANAIAYCGASPVFIDVDRDNLGMSAQSLEDFLKKNTEEKNGQCYNSGTGKRIAAVVPMHTFGHSCEIDAIAGLCEKYHIPLVEDAAESLGSFYKGQHTGTFGRVGVLSFNGNKTITSGGGGAIITNDENLGKQAKHITTTAKVPHAWEYTHDRIGFNYRMPNINAALAVAQLEQLPGFLEKKRALAEHYRQELEGAGVQFVTEPEHCRSNYWLNAILLENREERNAFLEYSNARGVMTRPVWTLLNKMPMYREAQHDQLTNSEYLEDRLVNIPSSVRK